MKKLRLLNFIPLLMAVPSITIGGIAMYTTKVPIAIFVQNIFYLVLAGIISYFILLKKSKVKNNASTNTTTIIVAVILLFLTFISSGIEGVHRWVSVGPIKFYVAVIVLPIIIINLWELLQIRDWWFSAAITIVISVLLALQPDASMLTAFAIPMIMLLWNKINNNIFRSCIVVLLSALIIISWVFLDGLQPVSYVENIVSLVASMGIIWLSLGVISLVILPLPFIFFSPKKYKLLSLSIGMYFIIILISTLFGNFPVPLMGYGVSPIIGYFISITWFAKSKINS
ncbi:cell division protein [Clostridium sp. CM028]|uniref:cell division protein n=2 Tax=unclassified Clostridium TaxID=2614128 RepID=UPI001C6E016A|nr:cell division protein [Clostridium sp. CM028]MBW9147637.1 cell division protein [Clostridium sp. CM028]WLC61967.1 cell division protein [Clostridium sp. CM028]